MSPKKIKALVVEDDPVLLENIKEILELYDYDVITAKDGAEGLKAAALEKPDLIICDIMMPKLNGYELKKELSESEELAKIPFIFLTAKTSLEDIRAGMNLGADDYITKPFEAAVLLEAIQARLNRIKQLKVIENEELVEDNEFAQKYELEDRFLYKDKTLIKFLQIADIEVISSLQDYSEVFLSNKEKYLMKKSLKAWEAALPPKHFLRVSKFKIINLNKIKEVKEWFNRSFIIRMENYNEDIEVSYRYASKIKAMLKI